MMLIARGLKPLASLKLTVVLFAMAMVVILAGTLAQVHEGIWTVVGRYFRSLWVAIPLQIFVPRDVMRVPGAVLFPGGFLIGGLMLVNLLAAHAVRFKLSWKRTGIIIAHLGIILLLVGEFVTGLAATEGNMSIQEGQSSNFVEDIRATELAVIDSSGATDDLVVVVPERMLRAPGTTVSHQLLPFEVTVDSWMANSRLLGPMQSSVQQRAGADHGLGTQVAAVAASRVTGVDAQTTDVPSAYVTLSRGGQRLGSFLVSVWTEEAQPVAVGEKVYGLQLRFKRSYKPYTMHLVDFAHDRFVGTDTPRNFSSRVRLTDPARSVDREALIYMNHPLRYAGETFYQQSFKEDDSGTVLQVVRNPGWLLPYVSCAMVGVGLLLHFGMRLAPAVRRRVEPRAAAAGSPTVRDALSRAQKVFPWVVAALAVAYVASGFFGGAGRSSSGMDFGAFGRIPVSAEGRTKPLDTFARNSVMVMSGRQAVKAGEGMQGAIEWLADAMARPEVAETREVFRIDHPDVVALLGLDAARKRFSFREVSAKIDEIVRQSDLAKQTPAKQRDPFQRQIVDLEDRVLLYARISRFETPYAMAPLSAGEEWRPIAVVASDQAAEAHPSMQAFSGILRAYFKGDAAAFNQQVAAYRAMLAEKLPGESRRAGCEVVFNRFEPFYRSLSLYVLAFLLAGVGFLMNCTSGGGWARSLARATMAVLAVALVVHTAGIVSRIYLQGRPPVTNLYSSAVFIGWVCVVLGLTAEWFFRIGLASITSSAIGFGTLVVAHNLSSTGDTMEMMQAVLDTNFWLATHVVVVTIGYSATFLAGFLGGAYVLLGVFTPLLKTDLGKSLPKMVYGVICFASLASFVGTVLGGIWADQSWGRFWGWDPKENGAALIVLMNVLTLHARWGGMVRERGVAVLAVLGNIVTAWSWFGTNMLGVGLHSYGFMASAVFWLAAFMVLQLVIMAIGVMPLGAWRSFRAAPVARPDARMGVSPEVV